MAKKSKKSKKSSTLSPTLFKMTGANAKMKVDDRKKGLYYFSEKVDPKKAQKLASDNAAEMLSVSVDSVTAGKPSLKYDFYCIYDAEVQVKYLSLRQQEIGVYEQLLGAQVGNTVFMPRKGKDVPGNAIFLEIAELYETKNNVAHIIDGSTGFPARTLESLLKGAGKKKATAAWLKKISVSPGKYNSVDKLVKAISNDASKVPKDAKRVVEHNLTFSKIDGFYVPTYYVTVTAGAESKVMRINAVNGNVALKV
ncbi:MAG: hypothetical protein ACFFEF_10695 [Candidatus Thorarchaeota archaeon]